MQAIDEAHELRPGPARPGPVGLLIRVVLGMAAVYGLVELVTNWDIFRDQDLIESDFWLITLFTLCLLPDVFNIGLRRRWGVWPLVIFLAGAAAIGSASYLAAGEIWTTALAAGCMPATCWSSQPSRSRSRWRSPRGHRDASSTRCRHWLPDCVARRMRTRAAASSAWTCSMGNRFVVPGARDEANSKGRARHPGR
jgi:hypothetical protein